MTENRWSWPAGSATGIGSMPGEDIVESVKVVFGELESLPYLPELPARGPGAEAIGRTAALLAGIAVEVYAGAWRVALRPGVDLRRTHDLLERDLDALTDIADGYHGPLKIQATGPWTLAANIDLLGGGRMLKDRGATRDLAASLADGLRAHVDQIRARVPGAAVVLQLDEPSLPAVLAGRVATESGLGTLRPVEPIHAQEALHRVVAGTGVPVIVHCCAAGLPPAVLAGAGVIAASLDLDQINHSDTATMDALGEFLDAGGALFAGAVASTGRRAPDSVAVADRVTALWRALGLTADNLTEQVVVTPACGLAGASADYARAALSVCVEAARRVRDASG